METKNREDKIDPALLLVPRETLRQLVQLFLDKLTVAQWVKLESGSIDKYTENVITDICLDMIHIVSTYIYEAFKRSLTEGSDLHLTSPPKSSRSSSSSSGSQKSFTISEDQVQECLGDTISQTFAEVMGVPEDTLCQSTKEVTKIVVEEVAERVNSELSKRSGSSGGSSEGVEPLVSTTSTLRLRTMTRHVVKILKRCATKMTYTPRSRNAQKDQQSPKVTADEDETMSVKPTEQDEELAEAGESCQTPVTPLQEDGPEEKVSSGESFMDTTTEAVKKILEEQMDDITSIEYNDDISLEEYDLLVSSNSQNMEEAASEIVRVIFADLNLDVDGTPKRTSTSQAKHSKTSCWQKVGSKVKAFLVHTFAKEAIFSFVAKLRSTLDCSTQKKDKLSVKQLIEGVDYLVEDMIPPEEDPEKRESTAEVCLYERMARDIASGQHEVTAKQLISYIIFHHLKLGNRLKVHFMVQIRTEVDFFMKMMWNWLNQQVQQHKTKKDRVTVAIKQIEGVVESLPVSTASHLEQRDSLTLVSESAPASTADEAALGDEDFITDEPAASDVVDEAAREPTAHPVNKWDKLCCLITVSGLVNQIWKNLSVNLSSDAVKATITTLSEALWAEIEGCDTAVKPSDRHIKRIIKAVFKDLCKKTLSAQVLSMSLLSQDPLIYNSIIQTLKGHLMTPKKKTSISWFFKTSYRIMSKPFDICFK